MRKARPDSVIASKLTEGQQAEFFATAQKLTVAEAAKLLQREFSVRLDKSNVSRWLQLYQQRNAFELYCGRLGAAGEQARGMLKELDREALGEALYGMAQQAMFQAHFDDASEKTKQSMAYVLSALGKALTDEKKLRQQERALDQENISATERNRIAREQLKLSAGKLRIDERKLKLLEAKAAQADAAKAVMTEVKLTPEERDRKIREILGL